MFTLINISYANECRPLARHVQYYTKIMVDDDAPWWYVVGLIQAETGCKWRTSLDGLGSIGFMQLTPNLIPKEVRTQYNIYSYTGNIQAGIHYLFNILHVKNPSSIESREKRLWLTMQMYNGGNWSLIECKRAKSFDHSVCYDQCINCKNYGYTECRGRVCVWRTEYGCKQYRHACDINYSYSQKKYTSTDKFTKMLLLSIGGIGKSS